MFKKLLLSIVFIFVYSLNSHAQTLSELNDFNKERINISKNGMVVLGAWSLANVAVGAIGYTSTHAEVDKNFHKMNMMWGGINFVFAAAGYVQGVKDKKQYDLNKSFRQQQSVEKTFLANAALDAVYISVGYYLQERAKNHLNKYAVLTGYGQSIAMQGAFLMCFDAGMFLIHNSHGNKKLYRFIDNINLSSNGIGVQIKI